MGHALSEYGVKPDFEKVPAVVYMPTPRNMKELQSFLVNITWEYFLKTSLRSVHL